VTSEKSASARLLSFIDEQLESLIALSRLRLDEFQQNESLRLIAERRLETTAQACIDLAHRILSEMDRAGVRSGREAILELSEIGVLPAEFAREFSSIAGFRNVLAHMYVQIDWEIVYQNLQRMDLVSAYVTHVREWYLSRGRGT
jgi:uncharacterized protein YutE (UPF0331/DUF86 family)